MTRCTAHGTTVRCSNEDHIMKIGLVGLGRMGTAMSHRLREHGFGIVGWDGAADRNKALAASGLRIAANPRALAAEAEIVISIIVG